MKRQEILKESEKSWFPGFSLFPSTFSEVFLNSSTLTPSQTTNFLAPSKLKEVADDNYKFDENCREFSKMVENTVGKGEIARHEQFLLFPQCLQKTCTKDT